MGSISPECLHFYLRSMNHHHLDSIEEDEHRLEQSPELPISSAPLKAAIHQIHSACKSYMDNFMLCKRANGNPQCCIDQNIQLTKCTFEA